MASYDPEELDPTIWGPHYWFFLHTIAFSYPKYPNTATKKKVYDFFHTTLPLFIPIGSISASYKKLLDNHPVTPYLDSRDGLIRWVHYIHNKINTRLEKPTLSLMQMYENYYAQYKPKEAKWRDLTLWKRRAIYCAILLALVYMAYIFYYK